MFVKRYKRALPLRTFSLSHLHHIDANGDPAGHTCVAVVGPKGKVARTLRTGSNDRVANMRAFAAEALKLMDEQLS